MKKFLLLMLSLFLFVGLTSCNNSNQPNNNEQENPGNNEQENPGNNEQENDSKFDEIEKVNKFITEGNPLLCAHRGGSVRNPENTLKAFIYAIEECDTDILESDVWLTKDGHLVLLHDGTVSRTSDATTYLGRSINLAPDDFTLEELQELNFGAKFVAPDGSKPYQNIVNNDMSKEERRRIISENQVSIITLDALFDYFYNDYKDLLFIIEIKNSNQSGFDVADKINEILRKYPDYKNNLAIGTFNDEVGAYVTETYPYMHVGASTTEAQNYVMDVLYTNSIKESYDFSCLQIPITYNFNATIVDLINTNLLNVAHEKGIAVQYWTINDAATMRRLIDAKCDAIMTDDPTLLRSILNESVN